MHISEIPAFPARTFRQACPRHARPRKHLRPDSRRRLRHPLLAAQPQRQAQATARSVRRPAPCSSKPSAASTAWSRSKTSSSSPMPSRWTPCAKSPPCSRRKTSSPSPPSATPLPPSPSASASIAARNPDAVMMVLPVRPTHPGHRRLSVRHARRPRHRGKIRRPRHHRHPPDLGLPVLRLHRARRARLHPRSRLRASALRGEALPRKAQRRTRRAIPRPRRLLLERRACSSGRCPPSSGQLAAHAPELADFISELRRLARTSSPPSPPSFPNSRRSPSTTR